MYLSTSSSKTSSTKALVLGTLGALLLLGSLEAYWRGHDARPSINPSSDPSLWAYYRNGVDDDPQSLVIIGTSRALFDFDLKSLSTLRPNERIRQLSIAATHPLATLEDLANDKHFNGKIICELTEEALASTPWSSQRIYADRRGEHFTLPEQFGSVLRAKIEDHVVLLNPSLSTLNLIKRAATGMPDVRTKWSPNRQSSCVPGHEMQKTWTLMGTEASLQTAGQDLSVTFEGQLSKLKNVVSQLHRRGIPVVFVRAPITPELQALYEHYLPRQYYWDRMVAEVDAAFITIDDEPGFPAFDPPDGSHLCEADAMAFTAGLQKILERRHLL